MTTWLDAQRPWLERARARWTPRTVEPLHLRIWLASPVAYDGRDPLTIEGALQYVVVKREACRETGDHGAGGLWGDLRQPGITPDDVFADCPRGYRVDVPTPIADVTIAGRLIACASIGWPAPYPAHAEGIRWRRKRADVDAYGITKANVSGGWTKALNIPVQTLATPWLDVYVRGDRMLLAELVQDTAFGGLGRDSTRGLGTILGVEIGSDHDDRSLLHRGAPQRVLPLVEDGPFDARRFAPGTWEAREAPTRAPYWVQTDISEYREPVGITRCAAPIVRLGMPIGAP